VASQNSLRLLWEYHSVKGSVTNSFRYTGRERDTETGLYYYRARYYDPATGRFVAEDPLRFRTGLNFFLYARNSPLTFIDPFGLCHVEMKYHQLGGAKAYTHTYLIVVDKNFTYYFRGGPENRGGGSSGKGWGNLIAQTGSYTPDSPDWDDLGQDLSDVILDDGKPCGCVVNNLSNYVNGVNAAGISYRPTSTNSNAFAYGAARAAGLNPGTPLLPAPGYDTNLPVPQ